MSPAVFWEKHTADRNSRVFGIFQNGDAGIHGTNALAYTHIGRILKLVDGNLTF
jgi:hypothetical protein